MALENLLYSQDFKVLLLGIKFYMHIARCVCLKYSSVSKRIFPIAIDHFLMQIYTQRSTVLFLLMGYNPKLMWIVQITISNFQLILHILLSNKIHNVLLKCICTKVKYNRYATTTCTTKTLLSYKKLCLNLGVNE